jgi:all-trans-retinol dehydrogenase (NAD+)
MSRIDGRTVLITGGASGIGYLTGRRLLEAGAQRLMIWDVREDALNQAVDELTGEGHRVDALAIDVADSVRVRRAALDLEAKAIGIDLLINNAGIIVGKAFAAHSHEDIERTMRINTLAPMHIASELLPGMLERGRGHIVNIASAAAMVSNPGMSVYCASKSAVAGWSDSLRIEMERAGGAVKVTTVLPYYVSTGMFAGVRSPVIPLLEPDHVAREIVAAIRQDRIFLRLPRSLNLVPLVRGILPTRWFDRVGGEWFGVYRTMSTFRGRT